MEHNGITLPLTSMRTNELFRLRDMLASLVDGIRAQLVELRVSEPKNQNENDLLGVSFELERRGLIEIC